MLTGVLCALLFPVGSRGLFGIGKSNDSMKTVYDDRLVPMGQLANTHDMVTRNRVRVMGMLLTAMPAHAKKHHKELRGN